MYSESQHPARSNQTAQSRVLALTRRKKKSGFGTQKILPLATGETSTARKRRSLNGIRGTEFLGRTMPAAQEAKLERIRLTRFFERTSKNGLRLLWLGIPRGTNAPTEVGNVIRPTIRRFGKSMGCWLSIGNG